MKHTTSHRRFAALAIGIVALLALVFAAPSSAKRIYKSVPTHVKYSLTRAADGTVTAKVIFTSPNPRCLSADRWPKLKDGYQHSNFSTLYYGSPPGTLGEAAPNGGWLSPISPAGHSPYVWRAIWPGSLTTKVHVEHPGTEPEPYDYQSTVAAASAARVGGYASPGAWGGLYYKYAYNQGGNRIILKCQTTPNGGQKEIVF